MENFCSLLKYRQQSQEMHARGATLSFEVSGSTQPQQTTQAKVVLDSEAEIANSTLAGEGKENHHPTKMDSFFQRWNN